MRVAAAAAGIALLMASVGWAQSSSTGLSDRHISGTAGEANAAVTIVLEGRQSVEAVVSGTWAGTLTPEVSPNPNCENTNYGTPAWTAVNLYSSAGVRSANTTANGTFILTPAVGRCARLRMSLYTSGTATVVLRASTMPPVDLGGSVSVNEPVSVDDNAGSLTVDNPVLSVVGGGLEATAQRVTLASDSTGVVSVDDNAASLTVDSAQLPAAFGSQASATSLAVVVASDQAAVAVKQATAADLNVTVGAGSNNIGDVDVDTFPAAATVNTQQAAAAADVTLIAAVANTRLMRYGCAETAVAAAAATVILRHGVEAAGSCTGNYIDRIELAPNESRNEPIGPRGEAVASGVCMDVTAGTVDCWSSSLVEAAP